VKLNFNERPNFTVKIIKFKTITPESCPAKPAKSKLILVRKKSLTTPAGSNIPSDSPKRVPIRAPHPRPNMMR